VLDPRKGGERYFLFGKNLSETGGQTAGDQTIKALDSKDRLQLCQEEEKEETLNKVKKKVTGRFADR